MHLEDLGANKDAAVPAGGRGGMPLFSSPQGGQDAAEGAVGGMAMPNSRMLPPPAAGVF